MMAAEPPGSRRHKITAEDAAARRRSERSMPAEPHGIRRHKITAGYAAARRKRHGREKSGF